MVGRDLHNKRIKSQMDIPVRRRANLAAFDIKTVPIEYSERKPQRCEEGLDIPAVGCDFVMWAGVWG